MVITILKSLIYLFISCLMLFFSKVMYDRFSSFKSEEQVKQKNHTPILAFIGYIFGVTIILSGAFTGPSSNSLFRYDLLLYVIYGLLGIVLMTITGIITDKFILNKFSIVKEMIEDKNLGAAAAVFGFYIASGLVIAACVNGEYGGIISALVYYLLGLFFMFLFVKVYDYITPYSIHTELENDNYAAGIALAGNIIAIGIILMRATLGDVPSFKLGLLSYFINLFAIFFLLPAVRFILGNIIIRSVNINDEIKNNNVAAGFVEFAGVISFALLIFFMLG